MIYLRQSTATTILVGPFSAKADGVTPITTLTTASTLNGRAVSNGVGAAYAPASFVHDGNGYYLASLAAADVPGVNRLTINFSDPATYGPVWHHITVYGPAMYDSLFSQAAIQTTDVASQASLATSRQYRIMSELLSRFAAGSYVSAADLGPGVNISTLIAHGLIYDAGFGH